MEGTFGNLPSPQGTEGQQAAGDGQASKMLNGQKQDNLSGGSQPLAIFQREKERQTLLPHLVPIWCRV